MEIKERDQAIRELREIYQRLAVVTANLFLAWTQHNNKANPTDAFTSTSESLNKVKGQLSDLQATMTEAQTSALEEM